MHKILVITGFFLFVQLLNAQSNWTFESEIEFGQFSSYKGLIDQKYPITMYLKKLHKKCSTEYTRWSPRLVYGWYMYDKIGKKIPLVGHVCYGDDCQSYMKLFVPKDPINYSLDENCNILDAREVFIQESNMKQARMKWQMEGKDVLDVTLESIHEFTWQTKALIKFRINNIVFATINLTDLTKNEYIEQISIISQKRVGDTFYLVFTYNHQSNPGSEGFGMCGAGYEEYFGFISMNKDLNVNDINIIQTASCIMSFEKEIVFDVDNPELGIKEKN